MVLGGSACTVLALLPFYLIPFYFPVERTPVDAQLFGGPADIPVAGVQDGPDMTDFNFLQ